MSADTAIQWAHDSVNFWWGCSKISAGCAHCYAEGIARRLSRGTASWGPSGLRRMRTGQAVLELLRLEKRAQREIQSRRVFINSMADTFEDRPDLESARKILFAVAPVVPQLNLLLLTKRPENVARMVPSDWLAGRWPRNVWLGVSAENQETARQRVHYLLRLPAPVRFISAEPLLGPIDFNGIPGDPPNSGFAITDGWGRCDGEGPPKIHWVIAGGESGQRARSCELAWLRDLRRQCVAAGVAFFLKQLGRRPLSAGVGLKLNDGHGGDMAEWPEDLQIRQLPELP